MADPQILYVVSAVVVLALVAWVIAVVAKAPPIPYARKNVETVTAASAPPPASSAKAPVAEGSPADPPEEAPPKSKLSAHLEIQDEKGEGNDKG